MGKSLILILLFALITPYSSSGQTLPDDELQVKLNTYFDNFRVNVVYPTVALTKQVASSTSINARYLIDAISSASMKSHFDVDGVTSATSREAGGGGAIDEIRHQFGVGVTQLLKRATLGLNAIYGYEADYASTTLATSLSIPFAKNNTILQVGFVRSWDENSPEHRAWTRDLDVTTFSAGLTQVLGTRLIVQLDGTYIRNRGFQSDAYTVISIIGADRVSTFEPIHPTERDRKAIGLRANRKLSNRDVLGLGYRYYTDDWDVISHTIDVQFDRRYASGLILGTGIRLYSQSNSFFFESDYTSPQQFMSVDSKLDESYSVEWELETILGGQSLDGIPVLMALFNEQVELTGRFNFYARHTDSPNWHSRFRTLYAYMFSVGYRYRL